MKSKLPRRLFKDTPEIHVQSFDQPTCNSEKKKPSIGASGSGRNLNSARIRKRTMLNGTSTTNNKSARIFRYRLNPGTYGYALRLQ